MAHAPFRFLLFRTSLVQTAHILWRLLRIQHWCRICWVLKIWYQIIGRSAGEPCEVRVLQAIWQVIRIWPEETKRHPLAPIVR